MTTVSFAHLSDLMIVFSVRITLMLLRLLESILVLAWTLFVFTSRGFLYLLHRD